MPRRRRFPRLAIPIVLVLGLSVGCTRPRPSLTPTPPPAGPTLAIRLAGHGSIVELPLEEYVRGSLLAEADLSGVDRTSALRIAQVQAILARTYAIANRGRHAGDGYDLCSTTHCQLYRPLSIATPERQQVAEQASRTTAGLVVLHEGRPINAVYHSSCGGHTSDAEVVWRGPTPAYLRGVPDPFCLLTTPNLWRFEPDTATLRRALNEHTTTAVGPRVERLTVTRRDRGGRAAQVVVEGNQRVVVRGEELRRALVGRFGAHSLKSTKFSVSQDGHRFVFEGRGFGHGVGLCQRGAAARARAGHSVQAILTHYYSGTTLGPYLGS